EKYLENTINSVLNQTFKNIEVIILNDGSTDNSAEIIKLFKEKDTRIEYIEQENQGVAVTRNKGIEVSKGDYILFIDADDELLLDAIEKMVNNMNITSSDIIVANFYWRKNNGILNENTKHLYEKLSLNILEETYIKSNMFLTNGRPLASSCNKLYKRTFLNQHQIQFKSNVFAEDRLFNLMCYVNSPIYSFIDEFTYIYNINN